MANFRKDTQAFLNDSKTIFEVPMIATKDGNVVDTNNPFPVSLSGGLIDAFGRLRVSNPLTIFDSKNIMSKNNLFDESLTGGGTVTYTANKSTVNLNVTQASGDKTIRQSKRVMSYQPGKSLLILNTFVMNTATANLKQKVGTFDANNGIFFYADGTTLKIVRRTYTSGSPVDTEISQSSWNGDKLDGTGTSGFTLDPAKSNILFIDIEWLGVGSVRVGFVINGILITAHTFNNANSLTTVYMQTANLPIRYEIETAAALSSGTYTLQQICSTCISEGGYAPKAVEQMVGTTAIAGSRLPTADTWHSIGTIRIRSGRPYAVIVPAGYIVAGFENTDFQVGLFKGVTLASGSFSYTNYDDNIEYDLTVRALSATGTQLASSFISGRDSPVATFGDNVPFDYQIGQTIGGTSEVITLAAKATTNNDDLGFTLKWYDLT